jgi:hypothetical protein
MQTLSDIMNNYSGRYVQFTLRDKKVFHGKIMMLLYNTVNREVSTPFCLDFDVIDDMGKFKEDEKAYQFKYLSVYEGQIEQIENWVQPD